MSGFTPGYIHFLHEVYGNNTNVQKFASTVRVTFIYKEALRILGTHCKLNDCYSLSFDVCYTQ